MLGRSALLETLILGTLITKSSVVTLGIKLRQHLFETRLKPCQNSFYIEKLRKGCETNLNE